MGEAPTLGNRHGHTGINNRLFRIASPANQTEDPLANGNRGDCRAHGLHFSGEFESEDIGLARRRWVLALALERIRPVERGCPHSHENLFRAGYRIGDATQLEHVRAARSLNSNGLHISP